MRSPAKADPPTPLVSVGGTPRAELAERFISFSAVRKVYVLPLTAFESFLGTTLCNMKPGHPDTTIRFDRIVHRSCKAILDYPTEPDDDPGIADLRDRFTRISSLSSRLSTNRVKVLKPTDILRKTQVIDLPPPPKRKWMRCCLTAPHAREYYNLGSN